MSSAESSVGQHGESSGGPAMQNAPVRKSITVKASAEHAFEVFTAGFDRWWPRSHHIGMAPMRRSVMEGRVGGRCYSEQTDGTECDWGEITQWEPPRRFVMAWKINAQWQYEPDLQKSSEVEVRFTPLADGSTRVDLEHRNFERMGAGSETMRGMVDSEGGWGQLMQLFATEAEKSN
ncbi:MAG: SRPBCC family protein [Candidatus Acidiferrales bacterium]